MESNNQKFKFKTNINCGGCVASVKPHLDKTEGINEWNVDTADSNKTLTVTANGINFEEIAAVVKKAGFKAELVVNSIQH